MTLELLIGGRHLTLNRLGKPLDDAFMGLYAAYFGNQPLDWDSFTRATQQFFDTNPADAGLHDKYFNNFTIIWQHYLASRRYAEAEDTWKRALVPALTWEEQHLDQQLHKGTPYYFWGMTVLLRGDLDTGYLLMHQALEEDRRTSGQAVPDTPGYALVSLNADKPDQAFREWVLAQAAFLDEQVKEYNRTHTRGLTIQAFKQRFLDTPPSTDAVFLLSYTIARLRNLAHVPRHAIKSQFAGQLELNILFDLTLVIDGAIKQKNQAQWKFIHHAEFLLGRATQPLANDELGEINNSVKTAFDATMQSLLNQTYTLRSGRALSRFQCDIAIVYGVRNQGAHGVAGAPTIFNHFPELQSASFRTLCATVEYLY